MAKPKAPLLVNTRRWYQDTDSYCLLFNTRWGSSRDHLQDFYVDTYCNQESKEPWGVTRKRKYETEHYDPKKHKGKLCKKCLEAFKVYVLKHGAEKRP